MKFRPGFRTCILLLYIMITISGLILLNSFSQMKQKEIRNVFDNLDKIENLSKLQDLSPTDSLLVNDAIQTISQSKSTISITLGESSMYSALILLGIIIVSSLIFIFVLSYISKPLRELKNATDQIRKGDFSVHIPETGIHEMKMLKNSFNLMSHELEAIQKKLLVAEKEMIWKDLSRILAHEIKNPLTPIQLTIQRIEERLADEDADVRSLLPGTISIINQEIENLRLLAQDFSSFAKISQALQQVFNPAEQIREIVLPYMNNYNIRLELEDKHLISFDKTHFYQIITNIVQNAIDASTKDTGIEIELKHDKKYIIITIRDHGSGIDAEDMNRIFEPYFSKKSKGTGLGLALVKRLSEANGSVVRAKSKPGQGSEFILIIEGHRT